MNTFSKQFLKNNNRGRTASGNAERTNDGNLNINIEEFFEQIT